MSETYDTVNKAWQATCKAVLGSEIGELEKFKPYLTEYIEQPKMAKSMSGKDVYYIAPYPKNSKFYSYDESYSEAKKPISLDSIKDLDSLLSSIRENVIYAGNKVLGNSKFVSQSENIIDSSCIYASIDIMRCENIAYSSILRDAKYMFGSASIGDTSFCIKACECPVSHRIFECSLVFDSSDMYYSHNCRNCQEMFFCFDQHSQRHLIGNNKLDKDKYLSIKTHLLEQIAGELQKKKEILSFTEMVSKGVQNA